MTRRHAPLLGLVLVTLLAALAAPRLPSPPGGDTFHVEARTLPPLHLQHATGGGFTNADLEGRWTLVATGYRHCPDICPTTLATLASVADAAPVQVLFVTMDPARDHGQDFADWVHWFSPAIIAATGSTTELDSFTSAFGFSAAGRRGPGGVVAHSTAVALVDPTGRLAGRFRLPLDPDAIAARLRDVQAAWPDPRPT